MRASAWEVFNFSQMNSPDSREAVIKVSDLEGVKSVFETMRREKLRLLSLVAEPNLGGFTIGLGRAGAYVRYQAPEDIHRIVRLLPVRPQVREDLTYEGEHDWDTAPAERLLTIEQLYALLGYYAEHGSLPDFVKLQNDWE